MIKLLKIRGIVECLRDWEAAGSQPASPLDIPLAVGWVLPALCMTSVRALLRVGGFCVPQELKVLSVPRK